VLRPPCRAGVSSLDRIPPTPTNTRNETWQYFIIARHASKRPRSSVNCRAPSKWQQQQQPTCDFYPRDAARKHLSNKIYGSNFIANSTRKQLWFEITEKLTAAKENKFGVSFIIIFGTLSVALHCISYPRQAD